MSMKILAVSLLGLVALTAQAQQEKITGQFNGTFVATSAPPGMNGQAISGSFQIGPGNVSSLLYSGPNYAAYSQDYFTITFDLPRFGDVSFGSSGGYVLVTEKPGSQQILLGTGFDTFYSGGALTLTGAPATLFSALDPTSLHPSFIDLASSTASISVYGVPGCLCTVMGYVDFSRFAFDTPTGVVTVLPSVAETPSQLTLLIGTIMMISVVGLHRRRFALVKSVTLP